MGGASWHTLVVYLLLSAREGIFLPKHNPHLHFYQINCQNKFPATWQELHGKNIFLGDVISFYRTNSGQSKLHSIQKSGSISSDHATHCMILNCSRKPFFRPVIFWCRWYRDRNWRCFAILLYKYRGQGSIRFSAIQKPRNHPNSEKKLSEWKGYSRSNSRHSEEFSEQLSEWHSRPKLCENPILAATLGATLGIGWTQEFWPKFSERVFFQNCWAPRPPELQQWKNLIWCTVEDVEDFSWNVLRPFSLEIEGRKSAKHFAKISPHFSPTSSKNFARTSLWGIAGTKIVVPARQKNVTR